MFKKVEDYLCHLETNEGNTNAKHYRLETGETPCIMFYNRETRQIAICNKASDDLIKAEKYRKNYFNKCINFGQVGKPKL